MVKASKGNLEGLLAAELGRRLKESERGFLAGRADEYLEDINDKGVEVARVVEEVVKGAGALPRPSTEVRDVRVADVYWDARTRALEAVLGDLLARRPDVSRYRHEFLGGRTLPADSVRGWVASVSSLAVAAADESEAGLPVVEIELEPGVPERVPMSSRELRRLHNLGERLAAVAGVDVASARRFVLTGEPPRPSGVLQLRLSGWQPWANPLTRRIRIEVPAEAPPELVRKMYSRVRDALFAREDADKERLDEVGQAPRIRSQSVDVLELVELVAGSASLAAAFDQWNALHPTQAYTDRARFRRAVREGRRRLLGGMKETDLAGPTGVTADERDAGGWDGEDVSDAEPGWSVGEPHRYVPGGVAWATTDRLAKAVTKIEGEIARSALP